MRNTKQREVIVTFINSSHSHPTANDIYYFAKGLIPNISLGTVYRILNNLVEQGLIKRIKMNDNIDRYDRISDFHAHFICIRCNKVYDLDDNFEGIVNNLDHKVIDYEINFRGICKKCLEEEKYNGIKR